jgi:lipoprotein signal peptidase
MDVSDSNQSDWPLRPWLLAGALGFAGLLVWLLSDEADHSPWRMAGTAFVFFGSIAAAFSAERDRWKEPLAFALIAGLVMAGLAWRATAAGDHHADEEYGFIAGVIATALALPLFQAGFHRTRFATPYSRVHYHVWTDAICAAGALAFTGAAWLLLVLMSELFHLLKIDLLRDLMGEEWFGWTYSGLAFGAALGTLRNQVKVLGTLQSVVTLVLSILAVPLALGLALFLIAMIVSGPEVLWQATRSATPVLLACAAGAWVLANAILRDSDGEMSGNRVLRWDAFALALSILPLTVFAAVSLGTRVAQHGLSPERLWGLAAITVACAYGLAWFVALVRGFKGGAWREGLRRANLYLAVLISGVALLLALPILDFGAISARNQIARLESGTVSPEDFDYAALRWDFGDTGRQALARLQRSGNPRVAELASLAAKQSQRTYGFGSGRDFRSADDLDVRVQPDDPALRRMVVEYLRANAYVCQEFCIALDLGTNADGQREVALIESGRYARIALPAGTLEPRTEVVPEAHPGFGPSSKAEIRTVPERYIFVDGRKVGPPIGND